MTGASTICLEFGAEVWQSVRGRIEYAFRIFAAIYNYRVVAAVECTSAIRCFYGKTPPDAAGDSRVFFIPWLYREAVALESCRLVKCRYADESFYLACGRDSASGQPDWLGEIFLWLSSSYERAIGERDSLGRVPYSQTVFARGGLSPRKPHAALLMAWMEGALRNGSANTKLPKATSPFPGGEHLVVCTHDIDFYWAANTSNLTRFAKNLIVATVSYGDWSFFADNFKMLLQTLRGVRVGDYLPALLAAAEDVYDFRSTFFVVSRRGHRRDPAYRLQDLQRHLSNAVRKGFSVGVHGSYRSVTEERTLREETQILEKETGRKLLGNRQHWLRFREHQALFGEIERAGLVCDSTLGFSDVVGFRNGASFAFPPYDFAREQPYEFLEIPLVLMDGSVEREARASGVDPQQLADGVLEESRKRSWGGVSILWHNPVESIQVPRRINDVFWNCAKRQRAIGEKWLSVDQFLACCLPRYQAAGLLQRIRIGDDQRMERPEQLACAAGVATD